jgi:hypothetical protein
MTCFAVILLAFIILFTGVALAIGLISIAAALIIIAIVVGLAFLLHLWRVLYPWLVRMGRWSAQLRNIVFLFVVLIGGVVLWYLLNQAGIQIPLPLLLVIAIPLGLLWLLLFLLAVVVWLVRLWRYLWPISRNAVWDICCRITALLWLIVAGILLGIGEIFHHPPLRWVVATVLFYFRKIAAAVAWLLYNPPLREIIRAGLFIARLLVLPLAWLLYHPPIIWLVLAMMFVLRLVVRIISGILYAVLSLPMRLVNGAREVLKRGLAVERESYQDYNHAHYDSSATA